MEEQHYTMAQLLAEEDARLAAEAAKKEQDRIAFEQKMKLEKEQKHQEFLEMKEKQRLEWEAEKLRRANTFEDKNLVCKHCQKEWLWTASEQKFFKEKGFFKPSMCKECRASMKTINNFRK